MYKVRLQSFEGPFDLLVYLIETAEMSIYDIKISQITNQYLEYLQAMQERNVAVATEFMVLAASLIEIKSKMILPWVSQEETALTEEDPRTELVERLLEYKRFKQAAQLLEEREEIGMRMFEKPQEDISASISSSLRLHSGCLLRKSTRWSLSNGIMSASSASGLLWKSA